MRNALLFHRPARRHPPAQSHAYTHITKGTATLEVGRQRPSNPLPSTRRLANGKHPRPGKRSTTRFAAWNVGPAKMKIPGARLSAATNRLVEWPQTRSR